MINISNKYECCGCEACAQMCPAKCISIEYDSEGFFYPKVNVNKCIKCGACENVCPIIQEKKSNQYKSNKDEKIECYSVINKDENVRLRSSSGGFFSIIAEKVLLSGGVVYGAAMSDDCKSVKHIAIQSIEELEKLRGSKYVQSCITDTYKQVKFDLQAGRKVLFSGTPCQVNALKYFLCVDYNNLICVDFICHGVPSPKVWRKYVEYREKRDGSTARKIYFRNKMYGWKNFALKINYDENKVYVKKNSEDLFMQAFLRDVCLRPSCHQCVFKKGNHRSDLIMADFWGVQNVSKDMDDDKGTSLVIVNSERGKNVFYELYSIMECKVEEFDKIEKYNSAYMNSSKPNRKRNKFFYYLDKIEFDVLVKKYARKKINYKEQIINITDKIRLTSVMLKMYHWLQNKCTITKDR